MIARGAGSLGAHLHAWSTPPLVWLTKADFWHMPYMVEYPDRAMREKLTVLSETLESTFGGKVVSHRAGRWDFNETYARMLAEFGYLVDCSVTPHVSWRDQKGDPRGAGGPDFSAFPESAYFVDLSDVRRPGRSALLEVPVTIVAQRWPPAVERARRSLKRSNLAQRVMRRLFPPVQWLRPNGRNRRQMLDIPSVAANQGRDYVQFMLHSSELMPGGSPTFATCGSVDSLYEDMEAVFERARDRFDGMTLKEYYHRCRGGAGGDAG